MRNVKSRAVVDNRFINIRGSRVLPLWIKGKTGVYLCRHGLGR